MLAAILAITLVNFLILCAFSVLTIIYFRERSISSDTLYSKTINSLIPNHQEDTGILTPFDEPPEDN